MNSFQLISFFFLFNMDFLWCSFLCHNPHSKTISSWKIIPKHYTFISTSSCALQNDTYFCPKLECTMNVWSPNMAVMGTRIKGSNKATKEIKIGIFEDTVKASRTYSTFIFYSGPYWSTFIQMYQWLPLTECVAEKKRFICQCEKKNANREEKLVNYITI